MADKKLTNEQHAEILADVYNIRDLCDDMLVALGSIPTIQQLLNITTEIKQINDRTVDKLEDINNA